MLAVLILMPSGHTMCQDPLVPSPESFCSREACNTGLKGGALHANSDRQRKVYAVRHYSGSLCTLKQPETNGIINKDAPYAALR